MSFILKTIDINKIPKSRVELHIHLDGSVRISTIYELALKKGFKFGERNTISELESLLKIKSPTNLADFLKKWKYFFPTLVGDKEAIERIAYELCEDQSIQSIVYFETRFSPQMLSNTVNHMFNTDIKQINDSDATTPRHVIQCVQKGLERGEKDFGVKARSILSSICGHSDWTEEVLSLAQEFKGRGVVGIDIAGDENNDESKGHSFDVKDVEVFRKAKQLGIHRTIHAGENGTASNVLFAVKEMFAERIGHGYHVIDDKHIYDYCVENNIHFETCPHSSYLTGSVKFGDKHPIVTFAEDMISYSINKDDTTPIQKNTDDEYNLLRDMGLNEMHFVISNINAIKASFLENEEKEILLRQISHLYGMKL